MIGESDHGRLVTVYRNNLDIPNIPPAPPTNLSAEVTGHKAHLTWSASSDAETISASGLNYNLYIGSTPGATDILSPMALPLSNGYRLLPARGHIQTLSATKVLPDGNYYWAVQAIDTAFAGSEFSTESSFVIGAPEISPITNQSTPENQTITTISFNITDTNTSPCSFNLTLTSSNETLIPLQNISYTCNNNQYTLTITPASNQTGTSMIAIIAQDADTYSSTTTFELNVLPVFSEDQDISLTGVSNGSVAFGDYDNDGDLDILMTGSGIAKIYRNTGGSFSEDSAIALPSVYSSSVAFGDYDNDGDLDILIAGNAVSGKIARIYRNTGGSFSEDTTIDLPGVYHGSVNFGDNDNDGDLDILIAGDSDSGKIAKIYRNSDGSFSEYTPVNLPGVDYSATSFGDYDNDGDLDMLLTGETNSGNIAKLYQNSGGMLTEVPGTNFIGVSDASVA
ncbi:MAG: hypothetical protein OMM_11526, partial [Candidatus Magnetoglobus multicellularis str. Araruama]